jgi:hypothetical protein
MNQKQKTKYLLKAHIKLCPTIKKPLDKGTKILTGIMIILLITGLAYMIMNALFIQHPENTNPTQEEIKQYCEEKNMQPNGYTKSYTEAIWFWLIKTRTKSQIYINCKTKYPNIYEIPEPTIPNCCYPQECPQAKNNPQKCNCIYLTYCIKISETEYKQWTYKINGQ